MRIWKDGGRWMWEAGHGMAVARGSHSDEARARELAESYEARLRGETRRRKPGKHGASQSLSVRPERARGAV